MVGVVKILQWVSGGLEAFFGIPVIGGSVIIALAWTPLLFMLALHIVTLVLSINAGKRSTASILGIITSAVGWIPVVGMVMHIITAIFLLIAAASKDTNDITFSR